MSVTTLDQLELLPYEFKYLGYLLSGFSFLYALIHHFIEANLLFKGLRIPSLIFTAGLIIIAFCSEAREDERVRQIRFYTMALLAALFIGHIFASEIMGGTESLQFDLASYLSIYIVAFQLIKYFNNDWMLNHRYFFLLCLLLSLVILSIFYDLLWLV